MESVKSKNSIQHYVIKFVSDMRQVWWFSSGTPTGFLHQ